MLFWHIHYYYQKRFKTALSNFLFFHDQRSESECFDEKLNWPEKLTPTVNFMLTKHSDKEITIRSKSFKSANFHILGVLFKNAQSLEIHESL